MRAQWLITLLLAISIPAAAEPEPTSGCVPVGSSRMTALPMGSLRSLLSWAEDAFCHPIFAPTINLYQTVAVEVPDGEVSAADQRARFSAALLRAGWKLDTSDTIWQLREAVPKVERRECKPASGRSIVLGLSGMVSLDELATFYRRTLCRPVALPRSAGTRFVTLPSTSAPRTPAEVDRLIHTVLRSSGFRVSDETALVIEETTPELGATADTHEVDYGDRIRCHDNVCQIDGAVVDDLLANPARLAAAARIVPAIQDGKPAGFKMYAIRPTSFFARIGFQNGDTLVSINGMALTSPDKALEAYTKVRDATQLVVGLLRRGTPLEIKIQIATKPH